MASEATPEGVSLRRCTNVIATDPHPALPRKRERAIVLVLAMRLCIRALLHALRKPFRSPPFKEGRRSADKRTTGVRPAAANKACQRMRRALFSPLPRIGAGLKVGGALASRRPTAVMRRGPYLDSAPGRASWNHRMQTGGPSPAPVQPAPGSPITRRTVDAQNRPDQGYKPHPGTAPAPSIGCHRSTSLRGASLPYVTVTGTIVKGRLNNRDMISVGRSLYDRH